MVAPRCLVLVAIVVCMGLMVVAQDTCYVTSYYYVPYQYQYASTPLLSIDLGGKATTKAHFAIASYHRAFFSNESQVVFATEQYGTGSTVDLNAVIFSTAHGARLNGFALESGVNDLTTILDILTLKSGDYCVAFRSTSKGCFITCYYGRNETRTRLLPHPEHGDASNADEEVQVEEGGLPGNSLARQPVLLARGQITDDISFIVITKKSVTAMTVNGELGSVNYQVALKDWPREFPFHRAHVLNPSMGYTSILAAGMDADGTSNVAVYNTDIYSGTSISKVTLVTNRTMEPGYEFIDAMNDGSNWYVLANYNGTAYDGDFMIYSIANDGSSFTGYGPYSAGDYHNAAIATPSAIFCFDSSSAVAVKKDEE